MPLHPQAAVHLAAASDAPALHTLTVADARRSLRGYLDLQRPAPDVAEVRYTYLVGPGSSLPVRIYRGGPPGGPVILMLHGSGFVAADIELSDEPARVLARDTGFTVVTVDYRKAPEHPYPAALDDAWAALEWIASGELDVDVDRIAVVGDSAGGTLTAALVRRARDLGGPRITGHAVLYPPLRHGDYDDLSPDEVSLSPEDMDWFWRQYLPGPLTGAAPPGAAPLDALHGFYWMDAVLDAATDLQRDLATWLRADLNGTR